MKYVDKNGRKIVVGDIIAQCLVGDIIWEGDGIITSRPFGIVIRCGKKLDVIQLRTGSVRLKVGCKMAEGYGEYSPISLDSYDGEFQWEKAKNIEVIGDINDDWRTMMKKVYKKKLRLVDLTKWAETGEMKWR